MKKRHQMTPAELKARLILEHESKPITPEEFLVRTRRAQADHNIVLGHRVGFGLALIELMLMYEVTDEELKTFIRKHDEFLSIYNSEDPDDNEEIRELFQTLYDRTGYSVLTGTIEGENNE